MSEKTLGGLQGGRSIGDPALRKARSPHGTLGPALTTRAAEGKVAPEASSALHASLGFGAPRD
jgi:hypothetical protein